MDSPTVGYHKIRGLAAPLRMMMYYKQQNFTNVGYASDMMEAWFAKDKPALATKNSCINLPHIIDGDVVVTQSNTCCLYVGLKLGIDTMPNVDLISFTNNHTVLDQTMDLRNDLMKLIYPGNGATKENFDETAKAHLAGTATANCTKLEGICQGPFMTGAAPQSGDFALFEMLDQHQSLCAKLGEANILDSYPKLKAMHAAMLAEPKLAKYFESDLHKAWFQNNGLFTLFTGVPEDAEYGTTCTDNIVH
jgi:glutathione S-transferase